MDSIHFRQLIFVLITLFVLWFRFPLSPYLSLVQGQDFWAARFLILGAICVVYTSWEIWKRVHPTASLFFGYSCLSFLFLSSSFFNWTEIAKLNNPNVPILIPIMGIKGDSAMTFSLWLALTYPLILMPLKQLDRLLFGGMQVLGLSLLISCFLQVFMGETVGGFIGNPSLAVAYLAITLPFLGHRIFYGLAGILVFFAHSHTAALIYLIMVLWKTRLTVDKWIINTTFWSIFGALLLWVEPSKLFTTSGRIKGWSFFMDYWWNQPWSHKIFGTGMETFKFIGLMLQKKSTELPVKNWWAWMHSDYLQCLFEQGIVGLVLISTLSGVLLHRTWKFIPDQVPTVISFILLALLYFPMHSSEGVFVGLVLVFWIFRSSNKHQVLYANTCGVLQLLRTQRQLQSNRTQL